MVKSLNRTLFVIVLLVTLLMASVMSQQSVLANGDATPTPTPFVGSDNDPGPGGCC
ncbi:MAG: hypothetical protein AAF846_23520 [Chloroflexota bacterium]